jgi:UTP--glucose-1-phosphate uridylyltransferase
MKIRTAVVPVAGWGTRLLPASKAVPKELFPLGRKPVIQHVIEELQHNGIEHIVFVTSPSKKAIEDHVVPDPNLDALLQSKNRQSLIDELRVLSQMQFSFVFQHQQKGLGHAVGCAQHVVNEPFVVALGDAVLGINGQSKTVSRLFAEFRTDVDAVIAFQQVPAEHVSRYGIASVGRTLSDQSTADAFILQDLVEKPSIDNAPSNLAIAARYLFSPILFDYLNRTVEGTGNEIQLTDAVRMMINDGKTVVGIRLPEHERRYDIGNFPGYLRAVIDFALNDPECAEVLSQFNCSKPE